MSAPNLEVRDGGGRGGGREGGGREGGGRGGGREGGGREGGGREGGGGRGGRGGGGRGRPAPLKATVVATERLSPHMARLTVTGEQFERYNWVGPAAHFKLTVPNPGEDDVFIPAPGPDGTVSYGDAPRIVRTYTARRYDAASRQLDIDFVLHGEGPVSLWAEQAVVGSRLAVSMPRNAGFTEDPDADWVLVATDTSALPAVATIIEVLTKPATIFVEAGDAADRIDLGHEVQWLTTTGAAGQALEQAIADFTPPAGRGQIWVAAEANAIRRIRARLLESFDRDQVVTRGYWRGGEVNHPDHDFGEDE